MKYIKTYESINSTRKIDLIRELSDYDVREYYNENYDNNDDYYPYDPDLEELLYSLNPWYYIDDDAFIENYKDEKLSDITADWSYENFDAKQMIKYIESKINNAKKTEIIWDGIITVYIDDYLSLDRDDEEVKEELEEAEKKDIHDVLNELNEDCLKKIIEEYCDIEDFCREWLDYMYKSYDAKQILSEEGYNRDHEIFHNNIYNITDYLDTHKMEEDWRDDHPYEPTLDDMQEILSEDMPHVLGIQRMVFENDNDNCIPMIEKDWARELSEESEFQLAYAKIALEREGEIKYPDLFIWKLFKKYFISRHITLSDELIEEYDLQGMIDAEREGFIGA